MRLKEKFKWQKNNENSAIYTHTFTVFKHSFNDFYLYRNDHNIKNVNT